jgi:glycosyltransferase involved in cell wall biosynthesis
LGKPPAREEDRFAGAVARERGLALWETRALGKHRRFLIDCFDRRRVRRAVREFAADIVHTHVGNDLRLALRAGAGILVHSVYSAALDHLPPKRRRMVVEAPAGLVVHSERLAAALKARRDGVCFVPPPLDRDRFDPGRILSATRALPIPEDRLAVGVVARMQPHRQFDVLLEAFREAVRQEPSLLLVIVGRGTRADEVAREPVKRLGLEREVLFPGYVSGEDYVALLKRFDLFVFLVPGTDGTCRALREAMAMGTAPIGSRRGMIPELLGDGTAGRLVDESVPELAQTLITLAREDALRKGLAREAHRRAAAFDAGAVAREVCAFYRQLLRDRSG